MNRVRLEGAAQIISERDYPGYDVDYEFTQAVSDALDLADVASDVHRIRLDDHATETVRRILARGAYQTRIGELPYEAQARAVVDMLKEIASD